MKIKGYLDQSLSLQFVGLMARFLLFIIIGAVIITIGYIQLNAYHAAQDETLERKETIIQRIDTSFNQAFFDFRGYFAYNNEVLKDSGYAQEDKLRSFIADFQEVAVTNEDFIFIENVREFLSYYYTDLIPVMIADYEQGNVDEIQTIANDGVTNKLEIFQEEVRSYRLKVDGQIESNYKLHAERNGYVLLVVGLYLAGIIFLLFRMTRTMFINIGRPISEFAGVANEIATGKDADMNFMSDRKDELGQLSDAFKKMVKTLQSKEQDLLGQNEELIAQQDELEVQKEELENVLIHLQQSENNLKLRNEFVKGISNSLNKQTVLQEIIVNMCKVTEADQGIISFLEEKDFASYGVSKAGEVQFLANLDNGLHERLMQSKNSFTVTRELEQDEKGLHEGKSYAYDLYFPVIDVENEVGAVLVLSRYGTPFPTDKIEEYEGFTKQISISLENIQMYDKTEGDRKRNQAILNTVLEGIQLVDLNGQTVQVNQKLRSVFSCQDWNAEIIGLSAAEWTNEMVAHVEDKEAFKAFFSRAIEAEEMDDFFQYTLQNKNEIYKVYATSLFDEEEKIGTVFVHRDITKEAEIDQMKSEFVSTVSHELRTPLASIYGYTELMLNRTLKPEKQKKYLTTIYQETTRLTSLINDFLDVQRMEAGKQSYAKKYVDLVKIIDKVVDTQQINASLHHFNVIIDSDHTTVLGDQDKLEQVFTNLISNAIKYSPDGGEIAIQLYQDGNYLKTAIKDEGLGIPKDALANLFAKFYRVDNSDRKTIGGTGLGLSIVKEISHAHDGDVAVSSEYGKGSTFTLSLPLVESIATTETSPENEVVENAFTVFVVEDDYSLATLIEQELRENKFSVYHYTKALDAINQLSHHMPDAIVLDLNLEKGEMDGWEFMGELKKMDAKYSDIPIIISSALEEKDKSFALGAIDYLVKPYKASDLSRTILQILLMKEKRGQIFIPDADKK
ncbi:ATP-binding protein [Paraliobacillus sp. X-1268]|uniref:ATP-binding protein n=1 Tax=Paraliobacillus sp. X-1268 TaxID=2213193 RepID=UPI000E3C5125|nr:ATP-binding protein [Paraliobacillus sp. X-1268]